MEEDSGDAVPPLVEISVYRGFQVSNQNIVIVPHVSRDEVRNGRDSIRTKIR